MSREPWKFRRLNLLWSSFFGITETSPIPISPSLDLRHVSDQDPVVDARYRELVGSVMWSANQTRPDIDNAVRAVARLPQDPTQVCVKAARKIIEYLSAAAHLGLTFRKDRKLEGLLLEHDLETYVDADYPHKADDRRSRLSPVWPSAAGVH